MAKALPFINICYVIYFRWICRGRHSQPMYIGCPSIQYRHCYHPLIGGWLSNSGLSILPGTSLLSRDCWSLLSQSDSRFVHPSAFCYSVWWIGTLYHIRTYVLLPAITGGFRLASCGRKSVWNEMVWWGNIWIVRWLNRIYLVLS